MPTCDPRLPQEREAEGDLAECDRILPLTPESIAHAFAAQQRERRAVELETGLVFIGDRLVTPRVADPVRLGLVISNAMWAAVHGTSH